MVNIDKSVATSIKKGCDKVFYGVTLLHDSAVPFGGGCRIAEENGEMFFSCADFKMTIKDGFEMNYLNIYHKLDDIGTKYVEDGLEEIRSALESLGFAISSVVVRGSSKPIGLHGYAIITAKDEYQVVVEY